MKKYLPILRTSPFFKGLSDSEILSVLHCVNAVTNALNEIDGVVAKVTLKSNSAEVSYDREINEADLKNAVKKAGYEVTGIS